MNSIAEIQRATAKHFGLSRQELLGPGRARRFAFPRQVGMAIAREDGHSFKKIGRQFGRHHTTVLHASRAISLRRDEIARDVAEIRANLALYSGVLVDVEKKASAAKAIGAFCASLGPRLRWNGSTRGYGDHGEEFRRAFGAPTRLQLSRSAHDPAPNPRAPRVPVSNRTTEAR